MERPLISLYPSAILRMSRMAHMSLKDISSITWTPISPTYFLTSILTFSCSSNSISLAACSSISYSDGGLPIVSDPSSSSASGHLSTSRIMLLWKHSSIRAALSLSSDGKLLPMTFILRRSLRPISRFLLSTSDTIASTSMR